MRSFSSSKPWSVIAPFLLARASCDESTARVVEDDTRIAGDLVPRAWVAVAVLSALPGDMLNRLDA